ncbi:hypothetical protein [Actinacidiphila alni]|uniref:hypothetical protein n=1 Tax=Actinacidiphila alni TaxID=380248 RepID=UPI001160CF8D|nr:hypothetical protein [Actinacidiphila alni]
MGKSKLKTSASTSGGRGEVSLDDGLSGISASELAASFETDTGVAARAKNAVISGAHFDLWLEPIPAARLLGICRARMAILERRGKPTFGVAECLETLSEMGEQDLLVAYVDDRQRGGRYFRLYLEPDPLKVVACIGVGIAPEDGLLAGDE